MKKYLIGLSPLILTAMPLVAMAQNEQREILTGTAANILDVVRTLTLVTFTLAVVVFGWGIVQLILAAGDPEKIKNAKQFIWWGVIGMAVLASLFGIIAWLRGYFGVEQEETTINVPTVE